jgi:thiamine biosynthesis lipoprotein
MTPPAVPARAEHPVEYAADSWRALGTYVQLVVSHADRLDAARALAVALLDAVDLAYSRFRDDSELAAVNRAAGTRVPVSALFLDALRAGITAAHETDGLVDPSLGRSLVALGYDADLDAVRARPAHQGTGPADLPTMIPPRRGGWREVELDADAGTVRIPLDVALDLGATGKAFAADLIAARIAAHVGVDCIVSLGGDVAVGQTRLGVEYPWQVAVSERPDDAPDETITLPRGGLATSSTTVRAWTHAGRAVHHLLDPATGRPVDRCWRTVSVTAPSCLAANTASTAAIVLGDAAPQWLTARGLAARLVDTTGTVTWTGAWPRLEPTGGTGAEEVLG